MGATMASLHKLTARKVATATTGKYEDGGGLRLVVTPSGNKKWVLRYTINRKRREMGLGTLPDVSLALARSKASKSRSMVLTGLDPIEQRSSKNLMIPNFRDCALEYIDIHRHGWKNAKHVSQWRNTLETYAFPALGDSPVDSIDTENVLDVLSPIWHEKTETAKRIQGRIENILDYASAKKFRDSENPSRWRGHLERLLPSPSRIQQVRHHPAMPYEEVPEFLTQLIPSKSMSGNALAFLIFTATRTSEVLGARWNEIDFKEACWVIPEARMKSRKEHRVPLSEPAIEILRVASVTRDVSGFVFTGSRVGKGLSNMALLQLMRGMGYGIKQERGSYVPHGFRSSFRDWAGEVSSFPGDVVEMALAHTIRNKVEAAYRRGDLFEKRRSLMNSWSEFLCV
jgi:integrase